MRSCSSAASFDAIEQDKYWHAINAIVMTNVSNLRFITTVFDSLQLEFSQKVACVEQFSVACGTVVSIIDAYTKLVYVQHLVVQRCLRYKN